MNLGQVATQIQQQVGDAGQDAFLSLMALRVVDRTGAVVFNPDNNASMGVVVHGAVAGRARPYGYASVMWIGTVEPVNAVDNDIWEDVS